MKPDYTSGKDTPTAFPQVFQSEYFKESNILNMLPCAVCVCDADGQIVNFNVKAVELFKRTPGKNDKEKLCDSLKFYSLSEEYLPYSATPMAASLVDGEPRENAELIIETLDSSRITVQVNIKPIKDKRGKILGIINCFFDITQEAKTRKDLARKARELQDYVDNAAIGLHWVNGNGIIKWANSSELSMLGYTEEEYIGHHISEFHVSREKINDILKRLSCNETLHSYESKLRCKDGSEKIVHISSNVFREEDKFVHTRCFTVDVTGEKRLFTALKESEARYKSLINSLPSGVYTCNKEGNITYFNDLAVQLWGYKPDINESVVKFCACFSVSLPDGTFVPPDKTPMAVTLATGQSFRHVEALVGRPDGSKFYASVNIEPLFNEDNELVGAINVFQDITDLKQAQMDLMESESRYRELIQSLDAPLYTTDAEGRVIMFNKAAAALWGREPEIGKDMWCGSYKIFTPDGSNLPLEECPMAVCLKEHRAVYGEEILVVRPDGSLRNVAPHPQPLFDEDGNMTGAINMLIDITDIKQTELALRESEKRYRELTASLEKTVEEKTFDLKGKNEQLKESEERYHKMIEEVEDYAIILLDKNGIIQNWNKGAEKIKGYKEQEIVGKSFSNFYLPADRESGLPQKLLLHAKENGKAVHEGWRMRKDGSIFWGSIVLTALHDDQNRIIGFSKVTRDLTERKQAEDRLKEYTNQLEFQNKELEQFAYAASHDMKEPLRKIHFYNVTIAQNPANVLDEKSKDFLNRSMNAVKRMNELIEDLLAYSMTTSSAENFEAVDLNAVIEEIKLMHKEEAEQDTVLIQADKLPVINAIPFQVRQLMSNLISNSIKYKHPDSGVCIEVKAELVRGFQIREENAESYRRYHKISVIDNGIGFNPQHSDKIFKIFQRLHNLPSIKGSGIGLAICKRIVQNHHGFIKAFGEENKGARFEIYLPQQL